ncbi:MAG: FKBP-type peptidyl-prolyl cis-trans isomerase [Euryarchaeota archaeon]|nr:FKBP-type peptidyl-prolyl cis-trans isomerase [Euryarchaeota archaeon]
MSTKVLSAIIIAIAIVLSSVTVSYVFVMDKPHQTITTSSLIVEDGDAVSVDYIGMFSDGRVFDTSMKPVAENNAVYPKAISFSSKGTYSPLNFTIGSGQMIAGFDAGVRGMRPNETKTITVSPDKGYGTPDPTKIVTRPLRMMAPVLEITYNESDFKTYYNVTATIGAHVVSNLWHWNATVQYVDPQGMVTVKNEPFIGEAFPFGEGLWKGKVISIDESANGGGGIIIIEHQLSQSDVGKITGSDSEKGPYIITGVDKAAGTFTIDFNREVVGKTLTFQITVLSITKKAA